MQKVPFIPFIDTGVRNMPFKLVTRFERVVRLAMPKMIKENE